ncbi:MAG: hypothetical protein EA363_12260 [Balneolaceae bacterium]|nr:MAG: hypothetical protein EA363_12260 [Balneolaceae bacterium]
MKKLFSCLFISALLFSCGTESKPTFTLSTNVSPPEGGSIEPSEGVYPEGEEIVLLGTPNEGWRFTRWDGDRSSSDNPLSLSVNRDLSITGVFEKRTYPLHITIQGEGTVAEKVVQQKSTEYPIETVVKLTPVPAEGWHFLEWDGDLKGSEAPETITITDETNVTAIFERNIYQLKVSVQGKGTVEERIIRQKTVSDYPFETVIELTPLAQNNWYFHEWGGDIGGYEAPKLITMTGDKNVSALFEPMIKIFGGTRADLGYAIDHTADGGYVLTGQFQSNNGDFENMDKLGGVIDVFVLKITYSGEIEWIQILSGSNRDEGRSIRQTSDNGYILAGSTLSGNGDFAGERTGSRFDNDIFLAKLDSEGNKVWIETFVGSKNDRANSVVESGDGGYVVTGAVRSSDGDFGGVDRISSDIFVLKVSASGQLEWKKTYGGSGDDSGSSIIPALDGGYVLTGGTRSNDGDFSGMNRGSFDVFVMKLDSNGNMEWRETYGGSDYDFSHAIMAAGDGGYVLTGRTVSNDGDFEGNLRGESDIFVIKLDPRGAVEWTQTYGGSAQDSGHSITQAIDGGFVLTGSAFSNDGDFAGANKGEFSIPVVKVDAAGNREWVRVFSGSRRDMGMSIVTSNDGTYVLTGSTSSNDGDFEDIKKGNGDIIVIRIDQAGNLVPLRKSPDLQ